MRFEVLGTVRVVVDGQVVEPISAFRRRLLAILLVRANQSVSVDTLVDALWSEDAPQRPANSLQVHIHRLRQVLDRADRLRGVPGGYQLEVGRDELDARVFADRHSTARNAVAAGDVAGAVAELRTALGLWRGAPYDGIDETDLVSVEARRLSEARIIAYEELYEAELRAGRAAEIVPDLTELVATYPLRERLVGHLMLAQYRSGRRSRAEMTYRATRQRLARELRTEPGRELRDLHEAIRTEDPALDPPTAPTQSAPTPEAPRPAQLPPAPRAFAGREPEVADLDVMTADGLVVVSGMAGVGKTALSVHYAHQAADRYGDGQLYLDLRGHSTGPAVEPLEALGHLLRGLGADSVPASVTEATAAFRSRVAGRKLLVLLDNAASAEQIRPLLPATSSCLTLVTSRNRLTGLVAREGAQRVGLGTLNRAAATALLAGLLGESRLSKEPEQVAELIRLCGGLPLALRIAAAQLADEPQRTLADYLAELGERGLSVLALDDDEESAVAAAFDLSYGRLDPDVRRLFRLAGLVPGIDFTVDALAALGGTSIADARAAVRALSNAHLLEEHAAGRFRFHDLLRDYAAQRAASEDSAVHRADALDRLYTWYYRGKETAAGFLISWRLQAPLPPLPDVPDVTLSSPGEAVAWLKVEFDNIVAAIRACADHGPLHWCWNLAIGVILDMTRHGRGRDVMPLVEVVADAARRAGEPQAIVLALGELGRLWSGHGRPMSGELITEMLTAAEASESAVMAGHAQFIAGIVHLRSNNQAEAIGYLERARDAQEQADDTAGLALTLQQLGNFHYDHGELRAALTSYERMVEIGGDRLPSLTAAGLMSVCLIRITIGEVNGLDDLFTRGARLIEKLQDRGRRSVMECYQASWYRDSGRVDDAIAILRSTADHADRHDLQRLRTHSRNELGICYLARGDHGEARAVFEQSLAMTGSDLMREYRAHATRGLALVDLSESSLVSAEARARESIELAIGISRLHEGDGLTVLARVQLALGQTAAAVQSGERALAIHQETSSFLGAARAHHVLGQALSSETHLNEALRRFATFGSREARDVRRTLRSSS